MKILSTMSAPEGKRRRIRRELAEKTWEEITNGTYFTSEGIERPELKSMIEFAENESMLLSPGEINEKLDQLAHDLPPFCINDNFINDLIHRIKFMQTTSVDAIFQISKTLDNIDDTIGVLNFASAKQPGGGFFTGAQAQEESLTRCSALYACLSQFDDQFYGSVLPLRKGIYSNSLIASPSVPFYKSDEGEPWDDIVCCDVVTCAAVNYGEFSPKTSSSKKIIQETMIHRVQNVIKTFRILNTKHIVLGAWGCGVFQNDTESIAQIFINTIHHLFTDSPSCIRSDSIFYFAIPDSSTLDIFTKTFESFAQKCTNNPKNL